MTKPENAFTMVRPRGTDAPTHTPRKKTGPKATNGTGLVLNRAGNFQAPLNGRAKSGTYIYFAGLDKERAATDNNRKIQKASI